MSIRLKLFSSTNIDLSTSKECQNSSTPKIKEKRTDVKPNNQHNFEACKGKFHFAIHPNEQKIGNNQKASKHSNPHCGAYSRPELYDHSCGNKLPWQGDQRRVNGVPSLSKGEGGIDEVLTLESIHLLCMFYSYMMHVVWMQHNLKYHRSGV